MENDQKLDQLKLAKMAGKAKQKIVSKQPKFLREASFRAFCFASLGNLREFKIDSYLVTLPASVKTVHQHKDICTPLYIYKTGE